MANHKSALKRVRQTVKKNAINRARRSQVRTLSKAVDVAIASGDAEAAKKALVAAESGLAKAASKGTLHRRTVARKVSRMAKKVKSSSNA